MLQCVVAFVEYEVSRLHAFVFRVTQPEIVNVYSRGVYSLINPLNPELNPICYLLALLVHHFLHVNRIRFKSLTIRLLMSYIYICVCVCVCVCVYIYIYIYIYGAPILDVSRSHTTTHHSR